MSILILFSFHFFAYLLCAEFNLYRQELAIFLKQC